MIVEFFVQEVRPLNALYKNNWFGRRKNKGFEYVSVTVVWAFDDCEAEVDDILILADGRRYAVIGKSGRELSLRLLNMSNYTFCRDGELLKGVGTVSGEMKKK